MKWSKRVWFLFLFSFLLAIFHSDSEPDKIGVYVLFAAGCIVESVELCVYWLRRDLEAISAMHRAVNGHGKVFK